MPSILNNELLHPSYYSVIRLDRSSKTHPSDPNNSKKFKSNGGGVLLAFKTGLNVSIKRVNITCAAEIVSAEISDNTNSNNKLLISTLYRVGTLGLQNFNEIENYFSSLAKRRSFSKFILIGDLNLSHTCWNSWYSSSPHDIEQSFLDLFSSLGLSQLISQPTHINGNILDVVLTNIPNNISNICVHDINKHCKSDHCSLSFEISNHFKRLKRPKRKIFNYKKADWANLNKSLQSFPWSQAFYNKDSNQCWNIFKSTVLDFCHQHIPTITIKHDYQPPWFDSELHSKCRDKERFRSKYKKSGNLQHYLQYSNCRREFRNLVNIKKNNCFGPDFNDNSIISKKFWKHVKHANNSGRIPESVSHKNIHRNKASDKAELFNSFFSKQFSAPSLYDINIKNDLVNEPHIDFSKSRVFHILRSLKVGKACGPDNINGHILKNCATSLAFPLSIIYKNVYYSGVYPTDWKIGHIVPVHKKGDKSLVDNYRPISLISISGKCMEYIIRDELMQRCKHLLSKAQHGFMPQHSCTTQMVPFIDSLTCSLNEGTQSDVVYFDFRKAFDSVNHDLILSKLKHNFHINGLLLKLIKSYLKNRTQAVLLDQALSSYTPVLSGVPQGSILGPLLFVIFINDIVEQVSPDTNIVLYADDTKLWRKINSYSDQIALQNDIDNLHEWSLANKMHFNTNKCSVLSVTNARSTVPILPFTTFYYKLGNDFIDYTNEERDLGLLINSTLNWSGHCTKLHSKGSMKLGLLKRSCSFTTCRKQRKVLYLTLIRSLFQHLSVIWSPQTRFMLEKLEKLQRKGIRWILNEPFANYSKEMYYNKCFLLDILPIEEHFIFTDLILLYQIINNMVPIVLPTYIINNSNPRTRSQKSDDLLYKSTLIPRISSYGHSNKTIHRKDTTAPGTKRKRRNVNNDSASIGGLNAFQKIFFNRTISMWNHIPYSIRSESSIDLFKINLKSYLWKSLVDKPD